MRDSGTGLDYSFLIEFRQHSLRDIGNITGEFLTTQFGLTDFDFELIDVNLRVDVFTHQLLTDDDGILEVVAIP